MPNPYLGYGTPNVGDRPDTKRNTKYTWKNRIRFDFRRKKRNARPDYNEVARNPWRFSCSPNDWSRSVKSRGTTRTTVCPPTFVAFDLQTANDLVPQNGGAYDIGTGMARNRFRPPGRTESRFGWNSRETFGILSAIESGAGPRARMPERHTYTLHRYVSKSSTVRPCGENETRGGGERKRDFDRTTAEADRRKRHAFGRLDSNGKSRRFFFYTISNVPRALARFIRDKYLP